MIVAQTPRAGGRKKYSGNDSVEDGRAGSEGRVTPRRAVRQDKCVCSKFRRLCETKLRRSTEVLSRRREASNS